MLLNKCEIGYLGTVFSHVHSYLVKIYVWLVNIGTADSQKALCFLFLLPCLLCFVSGKALGTVLSLFIDTVSSHVANVN